MKYLFVFITFLISLSGIAQNDNSFMNKTLAYSMNDDFNKNFQFSFDSISCKRIFLSSQIRKNSKNQSYKQVINLYSDLPKAKFYYKLGRYTTPFATLISIGGGFLAYDALKGTSASEVVEGKTYNYKVRSLPKLLIGIGLFAGGLCLLEYSNEFINTSVEIYNSQNTTSKKIGVIKNGRLGFTSGGGIGVEIKL